jgi:hypothetical protein
MAGSHCRNSLHGGARRDRLSCPDAGKLNRFRIAHRPWNHTTELELATATTKRSQRTSTRMCTSEAPWPLWYVQFSASESEIAVGVCAAAVRGRACI